MSTMAAAIPLLECDHSERELVGVASRENSNNQDTAVRRKWLDTLADL
jgi:hypothetical protein